jgi:hypothetical protein
LYPAGHFGLIPVTFFVVFPFTHVIVVFFAVGLTVATTVAEGVGVGAIVSEGVGVGVGVGVATGVGVGVGVGVATVSFQLKVARFNT